MTESPDRSGQPSEPSNATPEASHSGGHPPKRPGRGVFIAVIAGAILVATSAAAFFLFTPKPSGDTPQANGPAVPSAALASGQFGAPECDDYLARAEACMKVMPPAMRDVMKASYAKIKESWSAAATKPTSKAELAAGCKTALEKLAKNRYCRFAGAQGVQAPAVSGP